MKAKTLTALALVLLAAPLARAADTRKAVDEYVNAVLVDAQRDFKRSHAELGLVGSAAALEQARESRVPVAPHYGLISGLPLPLPVGLGATTACVERPAAFPAR